VLLFSIKHFDIGPEMKRATERSVYVTHNTCNITQNHMIIK
jgi:hypothetical protein